MLLLVQNMMCERCQTAVRAGLDSLGLPYSRVTTGEIHAARDFSPAELHRLRGMLEGIGLGLLRSRTEQLAEQIRTTIRHYVYHSDERPPTTFSVYLSAELKRNYTYLADLFRELRGITIGQCIIGYRVARVKELLRRDERSLGEIADLLHYSSPAHLSNQFQQITGMRPGVYRQQLRTRRAPVDL